MVASHSNNYVKPATQNARNYKIPQVSFPLPSPLPLPAPSGLRGDKMSVLTHTYPYKPLRKIKVTICNHQADSPLYVWPVV